MPEPPHASPSPYVRRSPLAGDLTPRRLALWDQHTRHLVALDPAKGPRLIPGTVGAEYFLEVPEHLLPDWERWPARRPGWGTENTLFVETVPLAQPARTAAAVVQLERETATPAPEFSEPDLKTFLAGEQATWEAGIAEGKRLQKRLCDQCRCKGKEAGPNDG